MAYFDPKLPFLSLKLLYNYFYIQNMDEMTLTEAGFPEKSKTPIFCHFWPLKIHGIHKHSNTCHGLNFHRNSIFFKCSYQFPLSESITIEITKNC